MVLLLRKNTKITPSYWHKSPVFTFTIVHFWIMFPTTLQMLLIVFVFFLDKLITLRNNTCQAFWRGFWDSLTKPPCYSGESAKVILVCHWHGNAPSYQHVDGAILNKLDTKITVQNELTPGLFFKHARLGFQPKLLASGISPWNLKNSQSIQRTLGLWH